MSEAMSPDSGFAPERDLSVLLRMVGAYFQSMSGQAAELQPASITLSSPAVPEYSGRMDLEGFCSGWISLGVGASLLRELLRVIGEDREDDAALQDMVGELVNTLVSNARAHFGARLKVRPPRTVAHSWAGGWEGRPPVLMEIPFRWRTHEGLLVVAIQA